MAWANVRPLRGSFALLELTHSAIVIHRPVSLAWWTRSEICFTALILLQTVEFWLLNTTGQLDIPIAACVSGTLIASALMITLKQMPQRTDQEFVIAQAQAQVAERRALLPIAHQTIALDEQSQTWADLMARISHEIRTPLNAVIGFSDLMERELFGPLGNPRYLDYAAHIKDSGDALLRSAEDTLALSSLLATQPQGSRTQTTSLSGLIRDAWFAIETQADRRGITLENTITDKLEIAGNRRAFRQALSNIMQEAMQRASAGTPVGITADVQGDKVRVTVRATHTERQRYPNSPSTAICVARALLELQGTSLVTIDHASGWTASTVLDLAVQTDFFHRS